VTESKGVTIDAENLKILIRGMRSDTETLMLLLVVEVWTVGMARNLLSIADR
jgi:hypothetical protein